MRSVGLVWHAHLPQSFQCLGACGGRYGTYKLVQKMPGGEGLVGFTRILHRTRPDLLMDEARPATNAAWATNPRSRNPKALVTFQTCLAHCITLGVGRTIKSKS